MKVFKIENSKLNIITTLINQLITTACGIIVPRIFIGTFGSEAYGITVSIAQFLSYITLLESGIGSVARAKLYFPLANKDEKGISSVYHAVKRFFRCVSVAFIIYSIVLGLVYHDIAHVQIFSRQYIFILVIVISLSTLAKYMGGLANLILIVSDQRQYVNSIILAGTTLINTAAVIFLVSLKSDLVLVKIGSSLVFIVRPLLYTLYVKKHYKLPKTEKNKAVLEQKWTGIGQHIAFFMHTNTDIVLLTLFADIRLVAVYSVYSLVINSIRAITEAFSSGMEAKFGELIAKAQLENLRQAFHKYKILLTAVSTILFCCTGALIVPFVKLYTHDITDADYIQPAFAGILLMAEAINCIMLPYASLPIASNHIKQTRLGAYGEAIINIILSCVLIYWNPLLGVAIGTLAATLFRGVFYMIYSSRHILRLPLHKLLLQFILILAVLCLGIFGGSYIIQLVKIENYLQWAVCGVTAFSAIAFPTIAISYFRMNKTAMKSYKD